MRKVCHSQQCRSRRRLAEARRLEEDDGDRDVAGHDKDKRANRAQRSPPAASVIGSTAGVLHRRSGLLGDWPRSD